MEIFVLYRVLNLVTDIVGKALNRPFAASGHMAHAGGQAAHWDIQNKAASSR